MATRSWFFQLEELSVAKVVASFETKLPEIILTVLDCAGEKEKSKAFKRHEHGSV